MDWLAEELLVAMLKAQIPPDVLLSDPIGCMIDEGALARYERRVLVRYTLSMDSGTSSTPATTRAAWSPSYPITR